MAGGSSSVLFSIFLFRGGFKEAHGMGMLRRFSCHSSLKYKQPIAQPQYSRSQSGSAGADTKNTRQMTIPESGSAWKIGVDQGDKSSDGQRTCGSALSALAIFPFGDEKGHRAEQFQNEID
ncbi:uncharacterized protein CIMG_04504 [Coccidioides immitis RS]|uniref:Uncharacterized protein n=2 Tax=Coccidioides immitis TaxID=5501 RepID=J3KDM2_COCIM|nr:uncharacterized protein CIMG_04504 [Coccidioides immitis RS]EAS33480.3 hypothetical protein CIMG_04504 [Coccidioides immitis RS]KMP04645.1 hypothetical protein CIRG_04326 [Coccidioides immitis RMSCC 2394]